MSKIILESVAMRGARLKLDSASRSQPPQLTFRMGPIHRDPTLGQPKDCLARICLIASKRNLFNMTGLFFV
jgi:hypothetical protein